MDSRLVNNKLNFNWYCLHHVDYSTCLCKEHDNYTCRLSTAITIFKEIVLWVLLLERDGNDNYTSVLSPQIGLCCQTFGGGSIFNSELVQWFFGPFNQWSFAVKFALQFLLLICKRNNAVFQNKLGGKMSLHKYQSLKLICYIWIYKLRLYFSLRKAGCIFELITLNRETPTETPHLFSVLARTCVVHFLRSTSMK